MTVEKATTQVTSIALASAINAAVTYGIARSMAKVEKRKARKLALWVFGIQAALGLVVTAAKNAEPKGLPPGAGTPGALPHNVAGAYEMPGMVWPG